MTKAFTVLASLSAAAVLAATPVLAGKRMTGEEELAKMLEGRTAGAPRSCLSTSSVGGSMTVIDRTAIVYRSGSRMWVNRTAHPRSLRDDDVMLIERFGGSQLCRNDSIKMLDRSTGMLNDIVFLDEFVPYEKVS